MIELNNLPADDIWPIIFSNLSINDLFNCRLVNKKFKYFSDHMYGLNRLIIGQPYPTLDEHYWYYNYKLIEDKEIISLKCFRSIKSLSIFNLDKYLKYLKIYDPLFKLKELSNLNNLESVEFGFNYANHQQIYKSTINLSNLKKFISNSDQFISNSNQSIRLNAPKLEKIKFKTMNQIKLDSNPESIKHLITCNYVDELKIFKNLEIIELRNIQLSINENLLIYFKNLRQLKINSFSRELNLEERIKNSLISILTEKMKLRKKIDIYLEGVKIENIDKLNEFKVNENWYWNFRFDNYDLLDFNLSFINSLIYVDLEKCFNNIKNDLPSTFFNKFQYIKNIYIFNIDDVESLNWFLNNLKCLKELTISLIVQLGQIFYDNLPNSITRLFLYNGEHINYDFISKFSKLIEFRTKVGDKDLSDSIYKLFLNLKYFKEFRICSKKSIKIQKNGKEFYLNGKKTDFNQLIEEYKKIRFQSVNRRRIFKKIRSE